MSLIRNTSLIVSSTRRRLFALPFVRRYQSSFSPDIHKLSNDLKDQNKFHSYKDILTKLSHHKDRPEVMEKNLPLLDSIFEKINSDHNLSKDSKENLHNFVLSNFIKYDPSLSTIHQRQLKKIKGNLTISSLMEIIKYNSGRVNSSWEIFENYYKGLDLSNEKNRDELFKVVIDKLVKGDSSDHEEDIFKVSEESLAKAIILSKNMKSIDETLNNELFKLALEYENFELIKYLSFNSDLFDTLRHIKEDKLAKLFAVWELAKITEDDIENNIDIFERVITGLSDSQTSFTEIDNQESKELISKLSNKIESSLLDLKFEIASTESNIPSKDQLLENIIEKMKSQLKSNDKKYESLKTSILKVQGINKQNSEDFLTNLLELENQSNINIDKSTFQSTICIISAYHYVLTGDTQYLDKAFENFNKEDLNIKRLQVLILASSFKNLENSLELYNNAVKLVSRQNNEQGISEAGLLTESLLLAYLSQQDREFAYLIHDGAVVNNVVQGDIQLGRLKAVFKRYGEIVGEEEEKIKLLLKHDVLKAIKSLI